MAEPPGLDAPPAWLETAGKSLYYQAARGLKNAADDVLAAFARAAPYANPDAGELVVDAAALIQVLANEAPGGALGSEGLWLADWLERTGLKIPALFRLGWPLGDEGGRLAPVLSRSIRGTLLPLSRQLCDADTGPGTPVLFRHLLDALVQFSPGAWPPATPRPVNAPDLGDLRAYLAERARTAPSDPRRGPPGPDQPAAARPAGPPEATPFLSDNPSADDLLGRRPLMQALAQRLVREQAEQAASPSPAAVMVHLHGAWGSGKSSLVQLLTAELGQTYPRWLVVDFNAWRNARVTPPWWNMLTELKRAQARRLLADVMPLRWLWLQLRWASVSPSVDNIILLAGALVAAALLLAGVQTGDIPALLARTANGQWVKSFKDLPAQLTLFAGLLTAGLAALRGALLGGRRVAESFDALRIDSYRPFIDLFALLTGITRTPVLIVLDDLDRCDARTVTDLLEGIQTLFRSAPVVFLAVGDRRWITASFARRFDDFQDAGGDQARPVGDLFLDKMFQLSVGVPQIVPADKDAFLRHLLGVARPVAAAPAPPLPADIVTLEAGQAAIAAARPEQRQAVTVQVALRLSENRADVKTSHRLLQWAELIEPNPRAMKRLVNAVGMAQTRVVLEQRMVNFDTIALWTMLELRWPRAADAIASTPALIDDEDSGPDPMRAAWADPLFRRLASELDAAQVRALLGIEAEEIAA